MAVLITPPQNTLVAKLNGDRTPEFPKHWTSKWHIVITQIHEREPVYPRYSFETACSEYVRQGGGQHGGSSPNPLMYNSHSVEENTEKDAMLFSTIAEINADDLCPICWPFEKFDPDE